MQMKLIVIQRYRQQLPLTAPWRHAGFSVRKVQSPKLLLFSKKTFWLRWPHERQAADRYASY